MRYFGILLLLSGICCLAEPKVSLGVEKQNVSVGESFVFQIKVSDADDVKQPVFPPNSDFRAKVSQPSRNSSTQVSIVNGKMTRNVTNELIYNIFLTPLRKGHLFIPEMTIEVDGRIFKTQQVPINVGEAEKIEDIALELSLDSNQCYVGQTLMATWRMYIGRNVQNNSFDLPLLDDENFSFLPYETPIDQNKIDSYKRVNANAGEEMIGQLKTGVRNGINVYVLEFSRPFQPLKEGEFSIDAGSVTCYIVDKSVRRRQHSPFDFFDSTPMKSITIAGNKQTLVVKQLPAQGAPKDFSGIIGKCEIETEAKPVDVNVGDPIVLTLRLKGLAFPDNARIPQFAKQAMLAKDFRISDEDTGKVQNGVKVFQCTIRAMRDDITEIPQLGVPYFDSKNGTYSIAKSESIPITVHAVKTVTVADVQGVAAPNASDTPSAGVEVKALDDGIAHNYSFDMLLSDQRAGFSTWSLRQWKAQLCLGSFVLYLLLAAGALIVKAKNSNPERTAARHAEAAALAKINGSAQISCAELYASMQELLRARLRLPSGTLTFRDVEKPLAARGISTENIKALKKLFDDFEAASYSGGSVNSKELQTEAKRLAKVIR